MTFERALACLLLAAGCGDGAVSSATRGDLAGPALTTTDDGGLRHEPPPGSDLSGVRDLSAVIGGQDMGGPGLLGPAVLTQHNDNRRTGANLLEAQLTPANVNVSSFGLLFTRVVDGYLYAQPLVVPGLTVGGKRRNVVYLATEHNSVYAYDADDPAASTPLWHKSLGTPVDTNEYTCGDLIPEDGVTSTPVIDPRTNTLYVSAKHKDGGVYAQTLHALDLITGDEKPGSPVDVAASAPGSGWGSPDGIHVPFNAQVQLQRPALLLANGQVYLAFGSHCDRGAYHGWVIGFDAATLRVTNTFNVTPNGGMGSIWMSGQGPSADENGNVYVVTSNGDNASDGNEQLTESFVELTPQLAVQDWFMPYNYQALNDQDLDLGSDGALLVPGSNLVISGGKEGVLYVVDRTNMGHFHSGNDSQIVQSFKVADANVHGTPVYFQSDTAAFIYVWPEQTYLMAFRLAGGALEPMPASQSPTPAPQGMPGGFLSISAKGTKNGILWASLPYMGNANKGTVGGVLRAFDATNLGNELWNSEQNHARDTVGNFAKFVAPTVVNGKVYLGTFSNQLNVYGLLH
jgi:hypothetical protein